MKMCRLCLDGIGEAADIACGDAWNLTLDKKPDFTEADGRNVIFARTEKGKEILDSMITDGRICVKPAKVDDLRYIQTYQYERRAGMLDKLGAMLLFLKPVPKYSYQKIAYYFGKISFKWHWKLFKGTVKRILLKRI